MFCKVYMWQEFICLNDSPPSSVSSSIPTMQLRRSFLWISVKWCKCTFIRDRPLARKGQGNWQTFAIKSGSGWHVIDPICTWLTNSSRNEQRQICVFPIHGCLVCLVASKIHFTRKLHLDFVCKIRNIHKSANCEEIDVSILGHLHPSQPFI